MNPSDPDPLFSRWSEDDSADVLPLAVIGRAHGLAGAMSLRPLADSELHALTGAETVWLRGPEEELYRVEVRKFHGKSLRIELEGVGCREEAQRLVHWKLCLPRWAFPELEDGAFYVTDLLGLQVLDSAGELVGVVEEVEENPVHQCLSIREPEGTLLSVPFVDAHVDGVDLAAGQVRLTARPFRPKEDWA